MLNLRPRGPVSGKFSSRRAPRGHGRQHPSLVEPLEVRLLLSHSPRPPAPAPTQIAASPISATAVVAPAGVTSTGTAETPFLANPLAVPGIIQADNFDNGGEGIAFHDTNTVAQAGPYRSTPVGVEACSDATPAGETASSPGVGYGIGHIACGEWLQYTVNVASAGTYAIDTRVASNVSGGGFHFSADGVSVTGSVSLPNTGGWQTWQTVTAPAVSLSAGQHVLRLTFDGNVAWEIGNVNYFRVRAASTTPSPSPSPAPSPSAESPFLGAPFAVPGTIQADNFDNGGQGVAWHDTTPGNQGGAYRLSDSVDIERATDVTPPGQTASAPGVGYDVGHIVPGEWLQYSIDVSGAGPWDLSARVASATGGAFHLAVDGVDVTGPMTLPNTGGWQTWQSVTRTGVSLSQGRHVLRLSFDSSSAYEMGNVNYIQIAPSAAPVNFKWSAIAPSPIARDEGQAIAAGGRLYAFGGFYDNNYDSAVRSDAYDPATNTWTRLADMPEALSHSGTVWDGTNIWLVGGFVGPENAPATPHVWRYNVAANSWTAGPSLPSGVGAPACVLVGRSIHIISGLTLNSTGTFVNTTEHWVLSLDGGGWVNAAAMPTPRNHLGAVVLNGLIYAIGGQDVKNEMTGNSSAVEIYNPATDTWAAGPALPAGRSHVANSTLVYNNKILVVGGESNGGTALGDTLQLDPATNRWTTVAYLALPSPRKAPNAGIIGSLLVVFGGQAPNPVADGWSGTLP